MSKVLHFNLKKKWFDMITSGEKLEEYREIKNYWLIRLFKYPEIFNIFYNCCIECKHRTNSDINILVCGIDKKERMGDEYKCNVYKFEWNDHYFKSYDIIEFKNGYSKNAPTMQVEFKGIEIGKAKPEWSDNWQGEVFVIKLGKILSNQNTTTL